jgi:hypothetical protein
MHNGCLATLEDVIEFYSQRGRPNPDLDSEIRPPNFNPEKNRALFLFLQSLGVCARGDPIAVRMVTLRCSLGYPLQFNRQRAYVGRSDAA